MYDPDKFQVAKTQVGYLGGVRMIAKEWRHPGWFLSPPCQKTHALF